MDSLKDTERFIGLFVLLLAASLGWLAFMFITSAGASPAVLLAALWIPVALCGIAFRLLRGHPI